MTFIIIIFFFKTTNKSESDCLARPTVSSDVLYINCTHTRLAYMCTVNSNCSIAEEFKSDDEVNISIETKDTDVEEEAYIFFGKSDQL